MKKWRLIVLAAAGGLLACNSGNSASNSGNSESHPPKDAIVLDADAIVLSASAIPRILDQCSRSTPNAGEGSWSPVPADIVAFEKALPNELKRAEPSEDWSNFPASWRREYVGLIRNGRKFIYGNFAPKYPGEPPRSVAPPTIVCDGGPPFFGAEWDIQELRISHLAFNGAP